MLRRLSLRKRILIAITAIAVIHWAFWYVPRRYVTRPRFYEEAWREAVSLLEEEVGAKAVQAGTFSIPREVISVPYKGECLILPPWGGMTAYLSVSQQESWLIIEEMGPLGDGLRRFTNRLRARRLSPSEARRLWATARYLTLAQAELDDEAVVPGGSVRADIDFADRTWRHGDALPYEESEEVRYIVCVNEFVSADGLARLVARLATDEGKLSGEKEVQANAAGAVLSASLPPVSQWDARRIDHLTLQYADAAGRSGLGLLRRIDSLKSDTGDNWLWRIGPIRRLFDIERKRRKVYSFPGWELEGTVWYLEELDSLPAEEAVSVAEGAAFSHPLEGARRRARDYLAANAPERLKAVILSNVGAFHREVPVEECLRWFGPDDEITARALGSGDPYAKAAVLLERVVRSHNADAFAELAEMSTSSDIDLALEILGQMALAYREDSSIGDVPGLLAKRLAELAAAADKGAPSLSMSDAGIFSGNILNLLGRVGGPDSLSMLKRVLEGQMGQGPTWLAVRMIEECWPPEVPGPMLMDFLERRPTAEWGNTEEMATYALERIGYVEALPVLEAKLWERVPGLDPVTSRVLAGGISRRETQMLERLREAILALRIRAAEDPVACFETFSRRDRAVEFDAFVRTLAERFDDAALKDMLADERFESIRTEVCAALVLRGRIEREERLHALPLAVGQDTP